LQPLAPRQLQLLLFVGAVVDSKRFSDALGMRVASVERLPIMAHPGTPEEKIEWLRNVPVIEVRLLPGS
jgi:hypothetical protein